MNLSGLAGIVVEALERNQRNGDAVVVRWQNAVCPQRSEGYSSTHAGTVANLAPSEAVGGFEACAR